MKPASGTPYTRGLQVMSSFTGELWREIEDIYKAILAHPFLIELTTGQLRNETFKQYIIQDALYLGRFSRAVALVAVKATSDEDTVMLLRNAEATLSFERASLHEFLLNEWGITLQELEQHTMSPVNRAYTDFLTTVAYEKSFQLGLAAILPCFWVYLEVGKELLQKGSPNKTYQKWIDTYSSEEYEQAVQQVVELMDKTAQDMGGVEKTEAKRLFRLSTVYEYLFWDEAYYMRGWPF